MNFSLKTGSAVSLSALGLALWAALPATAQELEAGEDDIRIEETIIVTSTARTDEAVLNASRTAGGADVVSHEEYADRFLVSMRDTLAFSPGVYTQPRYGQEIRISIRGSGISRGFHMRGLTLLQDGVELAFGNPWIIGNPPVHVRVDGEAVHDPEAAFLEMILTSGFFHG